MKKMAKFISISCGIFLNAGLLVIQANAGAEEGWGYENPPENVPTDLEAAIVNLTNFILGFIVIIATLVIVYGGILYLVSFGNDERIAQAKSTISSGIIGLVITGLAYAIVNTVVNIISQT